MGNLAMSRGDTYKNDFTVTVASEPFDLTGCEVWFTAKRAASSLDAEAVIRKNNAAEGGITVTSAADGELRLTLDPTDTEALEPIDVILIWDLQVKTNADEIYTVDEGSLLVSPDSTIRTS